MIYFITGGERSGKSSYAQKLALSRTDKPVYLATAKRWDGDFENRIARHQSERDDRWKTVEIELFISHVEPFPVIVLDCITLWLTNVYIHSQYNLDQSLHFAKDELNKVFESDSHWIIISNEIGMGVHAATEMGRKFVELQGWVNQFIAARSDEAYLLVSGIPLQLKSFAHS